MASRFHGSLSRENFQRREFVKMAGLTGAAAGIGLALRPDDASAQGQNGKGQGRRRFTDMQFFSPTRVIQSIAFPDAEAATEVGFRDIGAELEGNFTVSKTGNINGEATLRFDDGSEANISSVDSDLQIESDGVVLDFRTDILEDIAEVDGFEVQLSQLLELAHEEIADEVSEPTDWSSTTRSIVALVLILFTPVWRDNTETARSLGRFKPTPKFWCKAECYAVGAAIFAIIAVSCVLLIAACVSADAVSVGGLTVPCVFLSAVCIQGVWIGPALAINAWLNKVWNPT